MEPDSRLARPANIWALSSKSRCNWAESDPSQLLRTSISRAAVETPTTMMISKKSLKKIRFRIEDTFWMRVYGKRRSPGAASHQTALLTDLEHVSGATDGMNVVRLFRVTFYFLS